MGTFAETAIVDTVHLPTKENNLPFSVSACSKKRKFAVSVFHLQQTNRNCDFTSVPFSIYKYIQKKELTENIFVCLIKENRLGFCFLVPN
jgi:hypothetical protein